MRLPFFLSLFVMAIAVSAKAAIVVSVSPAAEIVPLGSPATVQIIIGGLGSKTAPSLGAYDLDIHYDPSVLSFGGVTFGDAMLGDQLNLSGAGTVADFSSSPALLEFFEISLDPVSILNAQQPGSFVLATLSFNTLKAGSSALLPSINSLADASGARLLAGVTPGNIQAVATPEPGTLELVMVIAVCAFGARGWRYLKTSKLRGEVDR